MISADASNPSRVAPSRAVGLSPAAGALPSRAVAPLVADDLRAGYLALGLGEAEAERRTQAKLLERRQIREQACEFEAFFLSMLMGEMRKGEEKSELFSGGFGEEIFEPMLFEEQARTMVKRAPEGRTPLGIAAVLERALVNKTSQGNSTHVSALAGAMAQVAPTAGADDDIASVRMAIARDRGTAAYAAAKGRGAQ